MTESDGGLKSRDATGDIEVYEDALPPIVDPPVVTPPAIGHPALTPAHLASTGTNAEAVVLIALGITTRPMIIDILSPLKERDS